MQVAIPSSSIRSEKTTKVYGRRSASLTIHIPIFPIRRVLDARYFQLVSRPPCKAEHCALGSKVFTIFLEPSLEHSQSHHMETPHSPLVLRAKRSNALWDQK